MKRQVILALFALVALVLSAAAALPAAADEPCGQCAPCGEPCCCPPCPCPPPGCTFTIGFWKTHAGFNGNNPDRVSGLLPIALGAAGGDKSVTVSTAAQAVEILKFNGEASNGINKLYAQLLAARLNQLKLCQPSACSGGVCAGAMASAMGFLANHNADDWGDLSKAERSEVLQWAKTLDAYNNGLMGVPHCEDWCDSD